MENQYAKAGTHHPSFSISILCLIAKKKMYTESMISTANGCECTSFFNGELRGKNVEKNALYCLNQKGKKIWFVMFFSHFFSRIFFSLWCLWSVY